METKDNGFLNLGNTPDVNSRSGNCNSCLTCQCHSKPCQSCQGCLACYTGC